MSLSTIQPACIRHTELPGTSRLFSDFAYHFDRVQGFYGFDPHNPASLNSAASQIQFPDERRAALISALRGQNGESESLARLARPGTVAVVTGQQVGLFSGPAYTVYKAITAAKLARQLSESGIPAVPLFWLASEDHDFAEVNHAWVFNSSSHATVLRVEAPKEIAGRQRPVGNLPVARPPIEELRSALQGMPFAAEVMEAVEEAYAPGASMTSGFRTLLRRLTSSLSLLFLDPLDPAIRQIGAPFLAKALAQAPELKAALMERNRELVSKGYHAQVHVDPKTSLFFLLENGERVTLRRKDSEFADLANRAQDVSPNALLRPVWQDYLLPTIAYIGGPGELAYLAQSSVIYERLLGRMPVAMSRSAFTLLDGRSAKLLDRYGLTVTQTFAYKDALKERIARALVPESLSHSLEAISADVARQMDRLKSDLDGFDHTLAAATEKSRAKILYQLEKIRRKTGRETMRRDTRATEDAQHLSNLLFPHRHLQERFYSILPFLAQHGLDLVDRLYGTVELDCPDHRVFSV